MSDINFDGTNDPDIELGLMLEEQEEIIENADRSGYYEKGKALAAIRDTKVEIDGKTVKGLYHQKHDAFDTFEEYCDERWEMADRHARRLIEAALFADQLVRCKLSLPAREGHVRLLLSKLDTDDDRIAVWKNVLKECGRPRDVRASDVEAEIERYLASVKRDYVTLDEWNALDVVGQSEILKVRGTDGLNKQTNADIEWADWSWNPVTGCLHGCPYCYARDRAFRYYPKELGFIPALRSRRLDAPTSRHPDGHGAAKNIFVCSMADLFGRWVPTDWIIAVLETVLACPQWNFLFLTKFPLRMSEFVIPPNAWMGTSVDLQARVANAEKAMASVKASVRWLSLEPMLEPLTFSRLDMFDWVVIGGASASQAVDGFPATPEWNVPADWLADVQRQARDAGCAVYHKTNSGYTGTTRLREYPGVERAVPHAPKVFDYLRAIPKADRLG
jgi:protein gp37